MKISTELNKINDILSRGVEEIVDAASLKKDLLSGKQLRIKLGIDPTGKNIHIGRASILWKLKDFQDLGHKIVLIIGDFTATIGDASDKESMRQVLTRAEVKENFKNYLQQIGKILDLKKVEVCYNSQWGDKLKASDLMSLAQKYTVQQMVQRRNFKERWEGNKPIGLHEIFYPIFQGYDSVMVKSDLEIGGFDQLFNLQAGRFLQSEFQQKPQNIMVLKMIWGLDGRKMSTSWGNVINILDEPQDMFGKIMSMKDDYIVDYFETCTRLPLEELLQMKQQIKDNVFDFRGQKARLGEMIVTAYYGADKAKKARESFDKVFKEKQLPDDMPVAKIGSKKISILDLLVETKITNSKQEARRLVEQGGVKVSNRKISDWKEEILTEEGMIVQVGPRKFVKIN